MDQCSEEPLVRDRSGPLGATLSSLKSSPRSGPWGLGLGKLNLKGAADTTVKIFLQKKQQKGLFFKLFYCSTLPAATAATT